MNKEFEFWIVWNPDSTRIPTHRHDYGYKAIAEAQRLAKENVGQQFYVLKAIGKAQVKSSIYTDLQEDVPF